MAKFKYKPFKKKHNPQRKILNWSQPQKDIFDFIASANDHSMIVASPGAGKSTTIIEALYHIPEHYRENNKTLFTAFNSAIAAHLKNQVPTGVVAKTHHQLGYHTVLRNWAHTYNLNGFGSVDANSESVLELIKQKTSPNPDLFKLHDSMLNIIDLSKSTLADSVDEVMNVMAKYGADLCGMDHTEFAEIVFSIMEKTKEAPLIYKNRSVITFSDMIWLPYAHGWMPDRYARVFVDEAQDLTPARIDLVLKSIEPGGKLCAVLDPYQCLYSFLGADENMHIKLQNQLRARKFPLSVSYRCGYNIVNLAKNVNPEIEPAENAHPGQVETTDILGIRYTPGTAILSRANYPLVKLCMRQVSAGVKANIQGKDIGNRLKWRIDNWQSGSVKELYAAIDTWTESLISKFGASKCSIALDEARCIVNFAENSNNIADLKANISRFFSDDPADVKFSSVHKAKGLEWDRVYMLNKTFSPDAGGEEARIWYVAVTRAKEYLGIANGNIK